MLSLLNFYFRYKPNILITNNPISPVIARLCNIPVLSFGDDIERRWIIELQKIFSTEVYYAMYHRSQFDYKGIKTFNSLKEWSYLSPKYFKPNSKCLHSYDLKEKEYIFVREVINGTVNYANQESNIISEFAKEFPPEYKVLLSLENKSTSHLYPDNWIILQEPIDDIHSLIYYSAAMVSSGDSMAREGAMLGVPSIYCGVRQMNLNDVLISEKRLHHKMGADMINTLNETLSNNNNSAEQKDFRKKIFEEWDDPNELILERFKYIMKGVM